jgi:hypothetical protein
MGDVANYRTKGTILFYFCFLKIYNLQTMLTEKDGLCLTIFSLPGILFFFRIESHILNNI